MSLSFQSNQKHYSFQLIQGWPLISSSLLWNSHSRDNCLRKLMESKSSRALKKFKKWFKHSLLFQLDFSWSWLKPKTQWLQHFMLSRCVVSLQPSMLSSHPILKCTLNKSDKWCNSNLQALKKSLKSTSQSTSLRKCLAWVLIECLLQQSQRAISSKATLEICLPISSCLCFSALVCL